MKALQIRRHTVQYLHTVYSVSNIIPSGFLNRHEHLGEVYRTAPTRWQHSAVVAERKREKNNQNIILEGLITTGSRSITFGGSF
jgi:hypothetical protein